MEHGVYLGLLPNQFYKMTIKEFNIYSKQKIKSFDNENFLKDRRTALIASILANSNRDRKKKPKPFTIEDFMPKKEKKKMNIETMANILKAITIANGGEVIG